MSTTVPSVKFADFDNICRFCFTRTDLKSIFYMNLNEIVDDLAQLKVLQNDDLPKNICKGCSEKFQTMSLFINKCRKSELTLRQIMENEPKKRVEQERVEQECVDIKMEEANEDIPEMILFKTEDYDDPLLLDEESNEVVSALKKTLNMDISDCDSMSSSTPEEIKKAKEGALKLLPEKSKQKYNCQYASFMEWCTSKNVGKCSESVILRYLSELSQKYKSSTLWSVYSMLKATLLVKNDIDIGNYKAVTSFLKNKSVGYVAKISKTFSAQEINRFLREAPDDIYLMTKVVLIIGVAGACRLEELTNLTIDNLQDKDDILIIHIPVTKNNKQRTFAVCNSDGKENALDILSICKKYFELRPKNMHSRRLFVKYTRGKCAAQNVGHHTIGAIPSRIAAYLNLPNSKEYTGHCFRRTSTKLVADSGADILTLCRRISLQQDIGG